jgi:hypothetical protein
MSVSRIVASVEIGALLLAATPVAAAQPPDDVGKTDDYLRRRRAPRGLSVGELGASCGVGHQGTVHCKTYNQHGFVLSSVYGVLW